MELRVEKCFKTHQDLFLFCFLTIEMGFPHSCYWAGGQWCDHSSLRPRTPELKPSSYLSQSSWDYKHATMPGKFFVFLVETGFHHVDQDGVDLLTS